MVILNRKAIVLMGFMGSGKSTLGRQLASLFGYTFTDLDRFIETEERRTISDIFEKEGEPFFRTLESKALQRVLSYQNQVIAIGGGAPCHDNNLGLIREKSISVYLKVSEAELLNRLAGSASNRPLLRGKSDDEIRQSIGTMMKKREPYYLQADLIIESDVIQAETIMSEIEKHENRREE